MKGFLSRSDKTGLTSPREREKKEREKKEKKQDSDESVTDFMKKLSSRGSLRRSSSKSNRNPPTSVFSVFDIEGGEDGKGEDGKGEKGKREKGKGEKGKGEKGKGEKGESSSSSSSSRKKGGSISKAASKKHDFKRLHMIENLSSFSDETCSPKKTPRKKKGSVGDEGTKKKKELLRKKMHLSRKIMAHQPASGITDRALLCVLMQGDHYEMTLKNHENIYELYYNIRPRPKLLLRSPDGTKELIIRDKDSESEEEGKNDTPLEPGEDRGMLIQVSVSLRGNVLRKTLPVGPDTDVGTFLKNCAEKIHIDHTLLSISMGDWEYGKLNLLFPQRFRNVEQLIFYSLENELSEYFEKKTKIEKTIEEDLIPDIVNLTTNLFCTPLYRFLGEIISLMANEKVILEAVQLILSRLDSSTEGNLPSNCLKVSLEILQQPQYFSKLIGFRWIAQIIAEEITHQTNPKDLVKKKKRRTMQLFKDSQNSGGNSTLAASSSNINLNPQVCNICHAPTCSCPNRKVQSRRDLIEMVVLGRVFFTHFFKKFITQRTAPTEEAKPSEPNVILITKHEIESLNAMFSYANGLCLSGGMGFGMNPPSVTVSRGRNRSISTVTNSTDRLSVSSSPSLSSSGGFSVEKEVGVDDFFTKKDDAKAGNPPRKIPGSEGSLLPSDAKRRRGHIFSDPQTREENDCHLVSAKLMEQFRSLFFTPLSTCDFSQLINSRGVSKVFEGNLSSVDVPNVTESHATTYLVPGEEQTELGRTRSDDGEVESLLYPKEKKQARRTTSTSSLPKRGLAARFPSVTPPKGSSSSSSLPSLPSSPLARCDPTAMPPSPLSGRSATIEEKLISSSPQPNTEGSKGTSSPRSPLASKATSSPRTPKASKGTSSPRSPLASKATSSPRSPLASKATSPRSPLASKATSSPRSPLAPSSTTSSTTSTTTLTTTLTTTSFLPENNEVAKMPLPHGLKPRKAASVRVKSNTRHNILNPNLFSSPEEEKGTEKPLGETFDKGGGGGGGGGGGEKEKGAEKEGREAEKIKQAWKIIEALIEEIGLGQNSIQRNSSGHFSKMKSEDSSNSIVSSLSSSPMRSFKIRTPRHQRPKADSIFDSDHSRRGGEREGREEGRERGRERWREKGGEREGGEGSVVTVYMLQEPILASYGVLTSEVKKTVIVSADDTCECIQKVFVSKITPGIEEGKREQVLQYLEKMSLVLEDGTRIPPEDLLQKWIPSGKQTGGKFTRLRFSLAALDTSLYTAKSSLPKAPSSSSLSSLRFCILGTLAGVRGVSHVDKKYESLVDGALKCGALYVRDLRLQFVNFIFLEKRSADVNAFPYFLEASMRPTTRVLIKLDFLERCVKTKTLLNSPQGLSCEVKWQEQFTEMNQKYCEELYHSIDHIHQTASLFT